MPSSTITLHRVPVADIEISALVIHGEVDRRAFHDFVVVHISAVAPRRPGSLRTLARRCDTDATDHRPHRHFKSLA